VGGVVDAQEQYGTDPEIAPAEQGQMAIVGTLPGMTRDRRREVVERTVDVAHVRRSFESFLANLRSIIDVDLPRAGEFELDEVQFSAEISANGDFKLLGTGVGLEAKSGVLFTLRRKSP
jgi:hypothetical protein